MALIREGAKGFAYKHDYNATIQRSMYNTQLQMQVLDKKKEEAQKMAEDLSLWDATDPVSSKQYDNMVQNEIYPEMQKFVDENPNYMYDPVAYSQFKKIAKKLTNNPLTIKAGDYQKSKAAFQQAIIEQKLSPEEIEEKQAEFDQYESLADLIDESNYNEKIDPPTFSIPKEIDFNILGQAFGSKQIADSQTPYSKGGYWGIQSNFDKNHIQAMKTGFYLENRKGLDKDFIQYQKRIQSMQEQGLVVEQKFQNPVDYAYGTYVEPYLPSQELKGQVVPYGLMYDRGDKNPPEQNFTPFQRNATIPIGDRLINNVVKNGLLLDRNGLAEKTSTSVNNPYLYVNKGSKKGTVKLEQGEKAYTRMAIGENQFLYIPESTNYTRDYSVGQYEIEGKFKGSIFGISLDPVRPDVTQVNQGKLTVIDDAGSVGQYKENNAYELADQNMYVSMPIVRTKDELINIAQTAYNDGKINEAQLNQATEYINKNNKGSYETYFPVGPEAASDRVNSESKKYTEYNENQLNQNYSYPNNNNQAIPEQNQDDIDLSKYNGAEIE